MGADGGELRVKGCQIAVAEKKAYEGTLKLAGGKGTREGKNLSL
jgi:hypothetical protein